MTRKHWNIIALASIAAICLAAGCSSAPKQDGQGTGADTFTNRFEYTRPEMGVPFRIVLYARDQTAANAAFEAAFARIAKLNDVMSDYEYDSELSTLSRTAGSGKVVKVSDDLWRALNHAKWLWEKTGGAHDITIGPAVSLWRKARREKKLPEPARLAEAMKAVGFEKLVLDPKEHTARLTVPRMRLDLGALAKGYAAKEALNVLGSMGIKRAMVAAAGDMAIGDAPPGKSGWRIEVAPLDTPDSPPPEYLRLENVNVATSGDMFQYVEIEGKRYSHIIDTKTGIGLTDHSIVTVITPSRLIADGLGTSVSVLGVEKGLKLIDSLPESAVHIYRKPGEKIEAVESKRFKNFKEQ